MDEVEAKFISEHMRKIARRSHEVVKAKYGRDHFVKMAKASAIVRSHKKKAVKQG